MNLVSLAVFVVLFPTIAAAQDSGVFIQAGAVGDVRFASSAEGSPGLLTGLLFLERHQW